MGWARDTARDHLGDWCTCKRACLNIVIVASLALRHTVEDGRMARSACICDTVEQAQSRGKSAQVIRCHKTRLPKYVHGRDGRFLKCFPYP